MTSEINLSGYSINHLNNLISPLAVDSDHRVDERTGRDESKIKQIEDNLVLMNPQFGELPTELQARIFSFLSPPKLPKLLTSSNSTSLLGEVKSELKKKGISKESLK